MATTPDVISVAQLANAGTGPENATIAGLNRKLQELMGTETYKGKYVNLNVLNREERSWRPQAPRAWPGRLRTGLLPLGHGGEDEPGPGGDSKTTNEATVGISAPVRDGSGKIIGPLQA
jgi:hypothetical protein